MATSYKSRYDLRNQAIDELLADIEMFREHVTAICAAFGPAERKAVSRLEDMSLLDKFHDDLLPTLRRMASRAKSSQLRKIVGESYILHDDEVSLVTDALLEKRTANLIREFIDTTVQSQPSDRVGKIRDSARFLLSQKTAAELTNLYTTYIEYEIYTSVARHCLITFIDPHTSSRSQRQAKKRIKREQIFYAESFKDRRWNVEYQTEQLSRLYDGLIDVIATHNWDVRTLMAIREKYDGSLAPSGKRTRIDPEWALHFTEATLPFTSSSAKKRLRKDESSLQLAIAARHEIETHLAHLLNLSPTQVSHLPALTEEFVRLSTERSRYRR